MTLTDKLAQGLQWLSGDQARAVLDRLAERAVSIGIDRASFVGWAMKNMSGPLGVAAMSFYAACDAAWDRAEKKRAGGTP